MPIRAKKRKGIMTLHIEGDMTIYNAAELKAELMKHLAQPGEQEIDLSGVGEMDTAGLQLLVLAKREAARLKTILHFNGHSRAVLEVINLCNMAGYFGDPIWES
jgi:anti-sigma B factor antagonist